MPRAPELLMIEVSELLSLAVAAEQQTVLDWWQQQAGLAAALALQAVLAAGPFRYCCWAVDWQQVTPCQPGNTP